jgi:hypothetical protein
VPNKFYSLPIQEPIAFNSKRKKGEPLDTIGPKIGYVALPCSRSRGALDGVGLVMRDVSGGSRVGDNGIDGDEARPGARRVYASPRALPAGSLVKLGIQGLAGARESGTACGTASKLYCNNVAGHL